MPACPYRCERKLKLKDPRWAGIVLGKTILQLHLCCVLVSSQTRWLESRNARSESSRLGRYRGHCDAHVWDSQRDSSCGSLLRRWREEWRWLEPLAA